LRYERFQTLNGFGQPLWPGPFIVWMSFFGKPAKPRHGVSAKDVDGGIGITFCPIVDPAPRGGFGPCGIGQYAEQDMGGMRCATLTLTLDSGKQRLGLFNNRFEIDAH
jgi:hypothetical protein